MEMAFFAVFLEFLEVNVGLKSENEFSPTLSWRRVTIVVKFLDFGLSILKLSTLLKFVERFSLNTCIRQKKTFSGERITP